MNSRSIASILARTVVAAGVVASAGLTQEVKIPPRPVPERPVVKTAPNQPATKPPAPPARPMQARPPARVKSPLPEATDAIRPRLDPGVVYHQVAPDGSLWAHGATYKASFGPGGASYIPFLGSAAPTTYPVTFRLTGAEVGGTPILVETGSNATREGDTIRFDRGGLEESYVLEPASMEQVFVFGELPLRGDLVVRMDVQTTLARSEADAGFVFANDLGHVAYGRATAIDATGDRSPAQTTLAGDSIEIRVPGAFVAGATLPLTIDPTVTTFDVDLSAATELSPDVAWDSTTSQYMYVWERIFAAADHDVWSQFRTAGGALVGGSMASIDFTGINWEHPRVANNQIADNFLTVAQVGAAGGGAREIWGCLRAGGGAVGGQFLISGAGAPDRFNPDVGGDPVTSAPTYYCIVWEQFFAAGDDDIYARLFDATGAPLGATFAIDASGALEQDPSVSKSDGQAPFGSQEWTITYSREFGPGDHDIWGTQVHWDGTVTNPTYMIDFTTPTTSGLRPRASSTWADPATTSSSTSARWPPARST
jgi:hypothetical protein